MHGFTHDTNRKILGYLGAFLIAVGCWMTYQFGAAMSTAHGLALGGLTIAAGVMWGPIKRYYEDGTISDNTARNLRIVGAAFIAAELFSHLGYTVGHRIADLEMSGVQNASYTQAQDAIQEDRDALVAERKKLADLKAAHPWASVVTADALRAQLPPIEVSLKKEANNCGRKKCSAPDEGKGPAWQILAKQKADIEAKVALAEEHNGTALRIAELEKRLEGRRDTGTKTAYVSSKLVHQTAFVSQLATLELKPSAEARNWSQIGIGLLIAFVTTFLGPVCWYLATASPAHAAPHRAPETKWAASGPEPAPTQMTNMRMSFRDSYNRHCRTYGTAAIPSAA